jgi:predicted dehydrogenase
MRIVQVGLGGWGWGWFEILREAEGIEVAGVAELSPETRRRAREELGLAEEQLFASLEEAMAGADAEAVLVASPPPTHHDLATAALEGGCHVLTEKPLATSLTDARSLVQTAERTGRILMVSQNYRFRSPARAVQQVVAEGRLGDVISVSIACRRDTRTLFPPGDFRYRMLHPYVLDMAIHHFDLLRALTRRDVEQVYARSWRAPDSPYEHDPAAAAIMTLTGGVTVTYTGDWATRGEETSWNGHWEVLGDHGRLTWARSEHIQDFWDDMYKGKVTVQRSDLPPERVNQPELAHVDRDGAVQAFRRAVDEDGPVETTAADNLKSLAVVMACIESIEAGAPVDVRALVAASGVMGQSEPVR